MSHMDLLVLLMINIPMAVGVGHLYFKSWHDFVQGMKMFYQHRNLFFFFGRDYLNDFWPELKFVFFLLSCVCLFIGEVYFLEHWIR